jgi:hypothetical protein
MEDRILDDDDIIDLTDLLEEGQPPGEREASGDQGDAAVSMNEPDSFDLGKEISMEYDVSVEEIESGGESLDIDADLSSNEEEALSQGTPGDEDIITLEDTGESLEVELTEDFSVPAEEEKSLPEQEFTGEVEIDTPEPGPAEMETPVAENDTLEQQEEPLVMDEASADGPVEESPGLSSPGEEARFEEGQGEEIIPQVPTDEVFDEIRQEIPSMIEGVVRPLITELVKEIVAASRDQLPGIVEKVIREEIDKLKKLDS